MLVSDVLDGGPLAKVLKVRSLGEVTREDVRAMLKVGDSAEPSKQRVGAVFNELDTGEQRVVGGAGLLTSVGLWPSPHPRRANVGSHASLSARAPSPRAA